MVYERNPMNFNTLYIGGPTSYSFLKFVSNLNDIIYDYYQSNKNIKPFEKNSIVYLLNYINMG